MRISDWSSDVCSSDLGVAGDHERPTGGGLVVGVAVERAADDHREGDDHHRPDHRQHSPHGQTVRGGVAVIGPVPGMGMSSATRVVRCSSVCSSSTTSLRSEAHTSELQSLMRTSYAVFCLTQQTSYPASVEHQQHNYTLV